MDEAAGEVLSDRATVHTGSPRRRTGVLGALSVVALVLAMAAPFTWTFQGSRPDNAAAAPSTTRTYYIAADPVLWNYAPTGRNVITDAPFDDVAGVFTAAGPDRIGSAYRKSLYQGYTDATFTTLKSRPAAWEHLGFLGPVIVTARNMAHADGTPKDVDRELVSVFQVTDENQSLDLPGNLEERAEPPSEEDEEFAESNLMHDINGYVFGNQPRGATPARE